VESVTLVAVTYTTSMSDSQAHISVCLSTWSFTHQHTGTEEVMQGGRETETYVGMVIMSSATHALSTFTTRPRPCLQSWRNEMPSDQVQPVRPPREQLKKRFPMPVPTRAPHSSPAVGLALGPVRDLRVTGFWL